VLGRQLLRHACWACGRRDLVRGIQFHCKPYDWHHEEIQNENNQFYFTIVSPWHLPVTGAHFRLSLSHSHTYTHTLTQYTHTHTHTYTTHTRTHTRTHTHTTHARTHTHAHSHTPTHTRTLTHTTYTHTHTHTHSHPHTLHYTHTHTHTDLSSEYLGFALFFKFSPIHYYFKVACLLPTSLSNFKCFLLNVTVLTDTPCSSEFLHHCVNYTQHLQNSVYTVRSRAS